MRIVRIGGKLERHPFGDIDPGGLEPSDLVRIIGKQAYPLHVQQRQHPRGDSEIALVDGKAKPQIGVDRIEPLILERIGAQLVEQRSEEHTSELQSLMRISYAVFCLKKKK